MQDVFSIRLAFANWTETSLENIWRMANAQTTVATKTVV